MSARDIEFNRGAVSPMQCMRDGWRLIKDDYWLFFGITLLGMFMAGLAPMGIMVGPMMCGLYLCFIHRETDEPVSISVLFNGFNFFGPGFVATLFMMVPMIVIMVVLYLLFVGGIFALIAAARQGGGPPGPEFAFGMIGLTVAYTLTLSIVSAVVNAFFMFAFPLIADKGLSGSQAVFLSIRAVFANFLGVFGLVLLTQLLAIPGILLCGVGVYFELPLHFAMTWIAYRQVFPREDPLSRFDDIHDEEEATPEAQSDTSMTADPANP